MNDPRTIADWQEAIGLVNAQNGWHTPELDGPTGVVVRLALIVTEVAEAIEEVRAGRAASETYYRYEDGGYAPKVGVYGPRKPEGVPSELADVVIRALDLAYVAGIDLESIIGEKLEYNATRGLRHGGKVV